MSYLFETLDLSVCTDCLMFIANGDLPADDSEYTAESFDPGLEDGWHVHAGDSDHPSNTEFSRARCEGCHTGLAGARYHAVALRRTGIPRAMLDAVIECALWSSTHTPYDDEADEEGDPIPFDDIATPDDISPALLRELTDDCIAFVGLCDDAGIDPTFELSWEQVGHNLWLTGQGHGTGFWDRGIVNGDEMTELSRHCCTAGLYLGDDGQVYGA